LLPQSAVHGFDKLGVGLVHHFAERDAEFAFGLAKQTCPLGGRKVG
jgi:hypothetical protein